MGIRCKFDGWESVQSYSAWLFPTPLLWGWIAIPARAKLGTKGVAPNHWGRAWRGDDTLLLHPGATAPQRHEEERHAYKKAAKKGKVGLEYT